MKINHMNRRAFLQGSGGFLLALPFLESLLPRAMAAGGIPKRFVAFWNPNGYFMRQFWPGADPSTAFASDVHFSDLRNAPGDISQVLTAARFGAFKNKINLCRGLDTVGLYGHNSNTMLSAHRCEQLDEPIAMTLDRVLAKSSKIYPTAPKTRALNLRPDASSYQDGVWSISFDQVGSSFTRVPNYWNEKTAYASLFSGASTPQPTPVPTPQPTPRPTATPMPGMTPQPTPRPTATPVPQPTPMPFDSAAQRSRNQLKAVDKVFEDFRRLKNSRAISNEDRSRIDNHMTMLSELEGNLRATAPPVSNFAAPSGRFNAVASSSFSCTNPSLAESGVGSYQTYDIKTGFKNHIDIMVAALACGLTNVGTLMARHNPYITDGEAHDPISHTVDQATQGDMAAKQLQISGFYADLVSYLLQRMDSIVEANGRTLLDNSLVFWSAELANGAKHTADSLQVFLAGGLQGYFKTGYYVDYRQRPFQNKGYSPDCDSNGRVYNQLLVSILQGMGLAPEDYEQNGVPGFGNYVCRPPEFGGAVDCAKIYAPYLTSAVRRAPLPFIAG